MTTCYDELNRAAIGRRGFLRGAGLVGGGALALTVGSATTNVAFAQGETTGRTLVVLSMRGAADGLSLVVPHGDPVYDLARPSIRVPRERLLVPDAMFGLHPELDPLVPMWAAGRMTAVHATGLPVANRSHFAAMEAIEDADPGSPERVGWLNRVLSADGRGSPLRAVQLGSGVLSTQLAGPHPVLTAASLDSVTIPGATTPDQVRARQNSVRTMWGEDAGPLGDGVRDAMDITTEFAPVHQTMTSAGYPKSELGGSLSAAARVIRADVGAEVVTVDHGSWDHHVWIGTPDDGNLRMMARDFATSVAAFFADLGPMADQVTLVTISEFGRRVRENSNRGLDHGHGNVMFVMGAGVRGGSYLGRWPGLANADDADLPVTTDYRHVLSEVVQHTFEVSPAEAFPGLSPERVGVMRV